MYMREPEDETPLPSVSLGVGTALAISLAATIYLGVLPGHVLNLASRSVAELLH